MTTKLIKERVCICDDCAGEACHDSNLTWKYDEDEAEKRKLEIRKGLDKIEEIGGYLSGPIADTIESSDEKCEVCGSIRKGYRHIFELREIVNTDEEVQKIMAQRAEDKKLANRINKASKEVTKHSKNIGKEFNNNIYFFWAVIVILTLLYIIAQ